MELVAQVMAVVNWVVASGPNLVVAIVSMLGAMIVVASLIPGDHPDKELQAAVDFLKKFSR